VPEGATRVGHGVTGTPLRGGAERLRQGQCRLFLDIVGARQRGQNGPGQGALKGVNQQGPWVLAYWPLAMLHC
jgi:hypothetical protein